MIADTAQTPAMFMPLKIPMFPLLSPPIALTGIGTAFVIASRVSVEVRTVLTLVVVGKMAPTPR